MASLQRKSQELSSLQRKSADLHRRSRPLVSSSDPGLSPASPVATSSQPASPGSPSSTSGSRPTTASRSGNSKRSATSLASSLIWSLTEGTSSAAKDNGSTSLSCGCLSSPGTLSGSGGNACYTGPSRSGSLQSAASGDVLSRQGSAVAGTSAPTGSLKPYSSSYRLSLTVEDSQSSFSSQGSMPSPSLAHNPAEPGVPSASSRLLQHLGFSKSAALEGAGGSFTAEGSKSVIFKATSVSYLENSGEPVHDEESSLAYSKASAGAKSAPGGATIQDKIALTFEDGTSRSASGCLRSKSKVSFHLEPQVKTIADGGRSSSSRSSDSSELDASGPACGAANKDSSSQGSGGGSKAGALASLMQVESKRWQDSMLSEASLKPHAGGTRPPPGVGLIKRSNTLANYQLLAFCNAPGGSSSAARSGSGSRGEMPHEEASDDHAAHKGLKSGFAAMLKKLATALDSNSSNSEAAAPNSGIKAAALEYKRNHGYLPTPSVSSLGGKSVSISGGSSMSLSGGSSRNIGSASSKTLEPAAAALAAALAAAVLEEDHAEFDDEEEEEQATERKSGSSDSSQHAAQPGLQAERSSSSRLPALPPGVVPLFGTAAGAGAGAVAPSKTAASLQASDALSNAGVSRSTSSSDASSVLPVPAAFNASKPLRLGPASLPGPVLLAVSPRLPPAMRRQHWCYSDFTLLKKLYDGYASTICKARDRVSGAVVALKMYRMTKLNEISSHQVAREVRLHIGLEHENIIGLYAAFQEAGNVVLVQEFAGGGDLWSFIDTNSGRLNERVTVSLVLQPFLRAISYLHSMGISHRDIKPENVLFSSNMVLKVADFGLAVNLKEERAVTRVGTLDYMAPEVLRCPLKRHPTDNKDRPDLQYAASVDAWAVGVLAYELLTGRAPFSAPGASDSTIETAIQDAAPTFPSRMSDRAKTFISAALNKNPTGRPSVMQMLQHPWIRSYQRSSSEGPERRGSRELGGRGRLIMPQPFEMPGGSGSAAAAAAVSSPSKSSSSAQSPQQQQQQMSLPPVSPAGNRSGGGGSGPPAIRQPSLVARPAGGFSRKDVFGVDSLTGMNASAVAAAATSVWNSDDNGLTGYAYQSS